MKPSPKDKEMRKKTIQLKTTMCPICKGQGVLPIPNKLNENFRIEVDAVFVAKNLRVNGYSYREIAKLMGYNNPQSIKHLIEKKK